MSHRLDHHSADHEHAMRSSEVFVGGLARSTTENEIHEVFSTCGEILEVRLIKDHSGNSKGYCFLRFALKAAADKAVKEKSGIMLAGKKIGVLPSMEQDSLFLGNLHKDWSADEFDKIVHQVFPDVVSIDLAMPLSTGNTTVGQKQQNRGFAIVKFSSHAAAARAYRLGSKPDFLLAANCHPVVKWAEEEPEVNPEELAKIKIAFVRNLPADADENYLKKLFEPLGKLDRIVLSKKNRSPVGFVHFATRTDLDNAIKAMNGKTIQGPNGGPSFQLMVEVARPFEKNKKRARDDSQSKPASKITSQANFPKDEKFSSTYAGPKYRAQELKYSLEGPVITDPYEAAVVSLPVAVKERLLRILRLGIATRYDINIQCLTSLKELHESTAISTLDQFMLSGAEKPNKGEYLSALISRQHVDKMGLDEHALKLSSIGDIMKESQLPSFSSRVHLSAVDTLGSQACTTMSGYETYPSRYSSSLSSYPLSHSLSSRVGYSVMEESSPTTLYRTPGSTSYSKVGLDSPYISASGRPPTGTQVRFDPFTGEPYKFDPFTGEPIVPESLPRQFGSPY
ncbi:APOBEC1 complementation factor like [Actinidia chinensis var. chinensis]|uniref:APOBEC1 complementation factor like n=1 Tax=Actinidia chinensis var. chinensis TaxID=1590841 RepID=A0A2R6RUJ7_ACTCC|nr:APOBEC1 complementation factor like [Actinidia chinensis var. chinensis]